MEVNSEFPGWKHYFPNTAFSSSDPRLAVVRQAHAYFSSDDPPFSWPRDCNVPDSVLVDYEKMVRSGPIPQFGQQLLNDPASVLGCLGVAMHRAMQEHHENLQPPNYPETFRDRKIEARMVKFTPEIPLRDIKSNMIAKFVAIRGNVMRVGNLRPLVTSIDFECTKCRERNPMHFPDGKFASPEKCFTSKCRSKSFVPIRSSATLVDCQKVRVQEIMGADGRVDSGRVPRTLEVELVGDLVDTCIPGDVVTICGTVKAMSMESEGRSRSKKNKTLFVLYLHANSICNFKGNMQKDGTGSASLFSVRDLYGISSIAQQPNLFALVVWSLCPAIYGHELVKAGLVLTLFGGSHSTGKANNARTDPHILIVGDPGLGKSQMLQATCNVAPRGIYVCGNTASTSGLTVTVVREAVSGDYALEAGALVMGDQGVCCIDEFDKMGSEHMALLEAMEQQSISVAKAGIVCTLSARTSVIAAANPAGGHYNPSKTVHENIRMSSAILSRFDLVFILLDKPDEEMDRLLSEHVMSLHAGAKAGRVMRKKTNGQRANPHANEERDTTPIKQRLSEQIAGMGCEPVPPYLLRKYIAYARKYAHPRLSSPAKRVLQDFYLRLRRQHGSVDTTPITTRQLESMIRLAEARARVELREEVTEADAQDVVDIMQESIFQTAVSDTDGLVFASTTGMSQAKKIKRFVKVLQIAADRRGDAVFTIPDMAALAQQNQITVVSFGDFVDVLNSNGYILKKGANSYQLVVSEYSQC